MAVEPQEIGIDEYNKNIADWGSKLALKIRGRLQLLTKDAKGKLLKSLRLKTAKWDGEIDKLAYHFLRHGVFLHKGVGRGYVMIGGSVQHVKGYQTKKSIMEMSKRLGRPLVLKSPASISLARNPKEWFNPVVKDNISGLADLVAQMDADRTVNATKLLIQ
jgi:hypothetical protein